MVAKELGCGCVMGSVQRTCFAHSMEFVLRENEIEPTEFAKWLVELYINIKKEMDDELGSED